MSRSWQGHKFACKSLGLALRTVRFSQGCLEVNDECNQVMSVESIGTNLFIHHHYDLYCTYGLNQSGSRSLWQGLRTITDYRSPPSGLTSTDESLANELNTFFARFEATSSSTNANSANANNANGAIGAANAACAEPTREQRPLIISDVRRVFKRANTRKAAGPDGICGRVLKTCTDQLDPVFTDIFNLSLTLSTVPSSFKRSTIVPVPKKPQTSGLNDYHPVALTSVLMKCFEKLVRDFITSSLPASMDPLQFAYQHNCSTDDATAHLLHTTMTQLDKGKGNYVKMLFVDYSSAFNTIIPSLLTTKLEDLGLHTSLCDWISNFLTDRPQSVRVGNCVSSTLTLSTGAPQGCVLSPLFCSLHTYDSAATSSSTIIVKFADDTIVMGLISDNDERAYLEEIEHLENWCQGNNLLLNISKTKELIVDCSKKQERHYQPVRINGTTVERVDTFRYLGVLAGPVLVPPHQLPGNEGSSASLPPQMPKRLQTALQDHLLQAVSDQGQEDCEGPHPTPPNNRLFSLLRLGKRFRSLKTNTERLKRSFFPQAIRALNQGN
ncbi:hypothetical protein P4O66_010362 [Electrophorus voltai]|uniref:Reverse transcriptase domain-containing protein n=1 Tax=Electrophorus voltai TaxID=2609070 RepID=A0AAD8ZCE7_9TELE|nr:hypothetical protein P4O66_010362 [Electrophorus voltai]